MAFRTKLAACLCVAIAIGGSRAAAADSQPDRADLAALLAPILEKHGLPALAGAIVEGGRVSAIGAVGVRERGADVAVTTGDLFHLGSCTKAMTATMLATLVEEGLLGWRTTVGEVFGDVPMMEAWRTVTIEQLLAHRAGVPSDLSPGGLWGRLWRGSARPGVEQRLELLRGVLGAEPVHTPGTKYLYANAGYTLAAAIAERLTGKDWESLMRERLFGPLGMQSAGFGAPGRAGSIDQPRGHTRDGTPKRPGLDADNPAAIGPGGTVHCTLEDWAKFISLHLAGERAETDGFLKPETFKKLHAPWPRFDDSDKSDYAMGWLVTSRPWAAPPGERRGRVVTHSGSNTMWFCVAWVALDAGFAVLVACNSGEAAAPRACDEAASAIIAFRAATKAGPE